MHHVSATTVARLDQINRVSEAIQDYDIEDRIEEAQFTEFEVGILVANDVAAEFIADLHHLMDFHGQDFDALLLAAQAKYEAHQEAVGS